MDDTFLIHIEIAGKKYPLRIDRKDEEAYRKAAKRVNHLMMRYRTNYSVAVDAKDLLAMTAFQLSLEQVMLEDKVDISPFTEKIKALSTELANYLNQQ